MDCPECGAWAIVKETRANKTKNTTRRRYECANEHRFTTEEKLKPSSRGKNRAKVPDARGTTTDAVEAACQTLSEVAVDFARCSVVSGVFSAGYLPIKTTHAPLHGVELSL